MAARSLIPSLQGLGDAISRTTTDMASAQPWLGARMHVLECRQQSPTRGELKVLVATRSGGLRGLGLKVNAFKHQQHWGIVKVLRVRG